MQAMINRKKVNDFYVIETFNRDKQLHSVSDKMPSVLVFKNKKLVSKTWYCDGVVHRDNNKPAYIEYYPNGKVRMKCYLLNNNFSRKGGPSIQEFYPNGNLEREIWFLDGKKHREDGPAVIEYYVNGKIKREIFYKNGEVERHIEDGPAVIVYDENGCVVSEDYVFKQRLYKRVLYKEEGIYETVYERDGDKEVVKVKLNGMDLGTNT